MVNIIGLVRHLLTIYPTPANWGSVLGEMGDFLKLDEEDPNKLDDLIDETTKTDAYRVLVRNWNRAGWTWDNDVGAVQLEDGEEATFDDDCITIAKGRGGNTMVVSLAHGEEHPRVVWF